MRGLLTIHLANKRWLNRFKMEPFHVRAGRSALSAVTFPCRHMEGQREHTSLPSHVPAWKGYILNLERYVLPAVTFLCRDMDGQRGLLSLPKPYQVGTWKSRENIHRCRPMCLHGRVSAIRTYLPFLPCAYSEVCSLWPLHVPFLLL